MNEMEYRGWVMVRGIKVESDEAGSLLSALEERHGELGPVLSGTSNSTVEVILAIDGENEAEAASDLFAAVADALDAAGLGALYPAALSIEPAPAEIAHA